MVPTYSIITPGQDAITYTQIDDIMGLLSDNSQMLITPKDVRDSIFSTWENSVFKYTTNSNGTNYIGISRPEIKNIKLLLGKKEILGSSVLSDAIINSNTDVDMFFYNLKSDSSLSQNLKIAFLAGTSQSVHLTPPYIEVLQVNGSTPSLSLNIKHDQLYGGDFNLIAGNNGRISLNNLILPSVNELTSMVSSPTTSRVGDLNIVRSSSGFIELRSGGTILSELGLPGVTTNIYGSDVFVNGYPLDFTESLPIIEDIGGIKSGMTFSNVPLVELLRQLLYPYLPPISSININQSVFERNHLSSTNVTYTYSLVRRSMDITSSSISAQGISIISVLPVGPTISSNGYLSNSYNGSYTFSSSQILSNNSGVFTFSIVANDGTQSYASSSVINFVYPYFYGFAPSYSNNQNNIDNYLTKLVDVFNDNIVSLSGTGYIYYCYPYNYGMLSEIYDGNGFLMWQYGSASNSWTYSSSISISSPSGLWTTSYRIFRTMNVVTIPPPSQSYMFKF